MADRLSKTSSHLGGENSSIKTTTIISSKGDRVTVDQSGSQITKFVINIAPKEWLEPDYPPSVCPVGSSTSDNSNSSADLIETLFEEVS